MTTGLLNSPFFSPDGASVGFYDNRPGALVLQNHGPELAPCADDVLDACALLSELLELLSAAEHLRTDQLFIELSETALGLHEEAKSPTPGALLARQRARGANGLAERSSCGDHTQSPQM